MNSWLAKYQVGQSTQINHTFTSQEVEVFAELSGDKNPVHLDMEYATGTRFGQRIVHGMLVAGRFSTIFGTLFPGEGAIYLGQNLRFTQPVYLNDAVTYNVTITAIRDDKPIVTFSTVATNSNGEVVITGEATILLP